MVEGSSIGVSAWVPIQACSESGLKEEILKEEIFGIRFLGCLHHLLAPLQLDEVHAVVPCLQGGMD